MSFSVNSQESNDMGFVKESSYEETPKFSIESNHSLDALQPNELPPLPNHTVLELTEDSQMQEPSILEGTLNGLDSKKEITMKTDPTQSSKSETISQKIKGFIKNHKATAAVVIVVGSAIAAVGVGIAFTSAPFLPVLALSLCLAGALFRFLGHFAHQIDSKLGLGLEMIGNVAFGGAFCSMIPLAIGLAAAIVPILAVAGGGVFLVTSAESLMTLLPKSKADPNLDYSSIKQAKQETSQVPFEKAHIEAKTNPHEGDETNEVEKEFRKNKDKTHEKSKQTEQILSFEEDDNRLSQLG